MNDVPPITPKHLFSDLTPTPAEHFRVSLYGAILRLLAHAAESFGTFETAIQRFPFLATYHNQLADRVEGLSAAQALDRWFQDLERWENSTTEHLPLRALRAGTNISVAELATLLSLGLTEDDARFGDLFESLNGLAGARRITLSLLRRVWGGSIQPERLVQQIAIWRSLGIVEIPNPDAPRADWTPVVPHLVWDSFAGGTESVQDGIRFRPADSLAGLDELILPDAFISSVRALPQLLASGDIQTVVVRGPSHNGRHTLLGALARSLGMGTLESAPDAKPDSLLWRRLTTLGLVRKALPILTLDLAPGEVCLTPDLPRNLGPIGIVLGRHGGIAGPMAETAVTLHLELPSSHERSRHWSAAHSPASAQTRPGDADLPRLGSGNLRRLARLSRTRARLSGRDHIQPGDIAEAARSLNRESLDSLAHHLPPIGDLDQLQASESTWRDLHHLEQRCRHRERLTRHLHQSPGGGPGCGVRALLAGPSGTGKTLAARLLAGRLQRDLYRLDLSAVVNKYIGETEKNLNRIFDRAEDLDVVLLLDEGDALLTRRTDVHSSNDRYANLETNFLLQRLESFQGIVLITTNARERIDAAFERRMDVMVEFHLPDTEERLRLWHAHLPPERNIDPRLLHEIAQRCQLTGGQIRNAALHASLLAINNGGIVSDAYLDDAVRREYLKTGALCPLRG